MNTDKGAPKKLKALEQYLKRQRLVARRICKRYINLYNAHDVADFLSFVDRDFADDIILFDHCKTKNFPITGSRNGEYQISGVDDIKDYYLQVFCNMPDGCLIVQSIKEKHKGNKVTMRMTIYGTLIRDIILPEYSTIPNIISNSNSNSNSNSIENDTNKDTDTDIGTEERKSVRKTTGSSSRIVKHRVSMQIILDDRNMVQRIDIYSL